MNIKVENYLEYLDKEMTIAGVLTTFCLAIPALLFERIVSVDEKSITYQFFVDLWNAGLWYLIMGIIFMFFGAAFFYLQRSRLAWFYGQIALEVAMPGYTSHKLDTWLKKADSWETWIPYHNARYTCILAVFLFFIAAASVSLSFLYDYRLYIIAAICIVLGIIITLITKNSKRYSFDDNPHLFKIF